MTRNTQPSPPACPQGFEPVDLPGAQLGLMPCLLGEADAERLLRRLQADIPWRQERVQLFGRSVAQPRLTAWYGDSQARYRYSGIDLRPRAWTPLLARLKAQVEAASGARFNSVLLNYYRDQRDSVGLHSDDEPELGPAPVIASLSLGARRRFVLRPRRRSLAQPVTLLLESGSLLLMSGPTQANWRHGVPRERQPCGPRINLTFRQVHDAGL